MRIENSQVSLQASHVYRQKDEQQSSLVAWVGQPPGVAQPAAGQPQPRISEAARRLLAAGEMPVRQKDASAHPEAAEKTGRAEEDSASEGDPRLTLVRRMVEMLTGEKVKVFDLQAFQAQTDVVDPDLAALGQAPEAQGQENSPARPAGYGIEFDFQAVHEEQEETRLVAQGQVVTADGKQVNFSLGLEMHRSVREELSVSYREGDVRRTDPLVINFGGTAVELAAAANQTFRFDLDQDGRSESVPLFSSGSGYLALDVNQSGTIDAAGELFGPATGDGFAELARLDDDGNGWIDEGDAAYQHLQVWTPGAGTSVGSLKSLAELDIGAVGLAHVQTPFALRGPANEDLGVVRDTGVYLTNGGKAGSVQEIDVTI